MRIGRWLAVAALLGQGVGVSAQDTQPGVAPEARIWLDRGDEPLLQRGDRARVYYRTAADAYVAILHIDTDGAVTLLHPRAPEEDSYTRGERDYRLLFPQSSYWFVDEYPGKGYFFLVASPEPLDLSGFDYARLERRWDLTRVGRAVYRDPYLAMDDYVARLIPDWESVPYALDFVTYDVGEVHEYPRFLCYDCHGYRSYAAWNPYTYACASFRVVVWDDPWFYPSFRYQGVRITYAEPRRGVARFAFKERAEGETWTPLTRTRQPPVRRSVEYVEPSAAQARPSAPQGVPLRRPNTGSDPDRSIAPARRAPDAAPSQAQPPSRRPVPSSGAVPRPSSSAGPARTPVTSVAPPRRTEPAGGVAPNPSRTSQDRPVLQRRPSSPAPSRPQGGTTVRPPSPDRAATLTRPSGGGTRVVVPPRSGASSSRPSGGSRPSPSARPSSGSGGRATAPPPRRKPGGGGS